MNKSKLLGALAIVICQTSALWASTTEVINNLNQSNKVKITMSERRYRTIKNGKLTFSKVPTYSLRFIMLSDASSYFGKTYRFPFVLNGAIGRYTIKTDWTEPNKNSLEIKLYVPSGGKALVRKYIGKSPEKKHLTIKAINLSRYNKGKRAVFVLKTKKCNVFNGQITLEYAPKQTTTDKLKKGLSKRKRKNVVGRKKYRGIKQRKGIGAAQ